MHWATYQSLCAKKPPFSATILKPTAATASRSSAKFEAVKKLHEYVQHASECREMPRSIRDQKAMAYEVARFARRRMRPHSSRLWSGPTVMLANS